MKNIKASQKTSKDRQALAFYYTCFKNDVYSRSYIFRIVLSANIFFIKEYSIMEQTISAAPAKTAVPASSRIVWIDQARAAAMFLVVVGHVYLSKDLKDLIYSFHMPLFFFISGLTFNPNKQTSLKAQAKSKFQALVLPHVWMNLLMLPLWVYTFKVLGDKTTPIYKLFYGIIFSNAEKYQAPTNATWFLLTLALTLLLMTAIFILSKGDLRLVSLAVFICSVLGFAESLGKNPPMIWHLSVVFTAIAFVFLGHLFMRYLPRIESIFKKMGVIKYWLTVIICIALGIYFSRLNGRISMHVNKYRTYTYFYITALLFILAFMMIMIKIPKIRLLTFIGQNTMLYVGIHLPIIRLFEHLPMFEFVGERMRYSVPFAIILFFAIAPLCLLVNRFVPFIVGKKRRRRHITQ